MGKYIEVFVAFDVAKKKHAVAIAEGIGCIFVLKLGRRDTGFIGKSKRSATNAWWSLRL